ncbi:unnamed protein product, partial [Laminaria digitata]
MESIDGTLAAWLEKRRSKHFLDMFIVAFALTLKKFKEYSFIHGDFHIENIGYTFVSKTSVKLVPIDFGRFSNKKALTELDILKFLKTLHPRFFPVDEFNTVYL